MSEKTPIYENAPTTDRPAEMVAQGHGFESVAALAEILPPRARVLDVGAGASPFGKEVSALRPDITWVNLDYSYLNPAILTEASQDVPPNVSFVSGDAITLGKLCNPEEFDAVFSYWLFNHLSIDDEAPARKAANAIFTATRPSGLIAIGPTVSKHRVISKRFFPPFEESYKVMKSNQLRVEEFREAVVQKTKLHGVYPYTQKFSNRVIVPFFGTTRYARRTNGKPEIYDPKTGNYVSSTSRRSVQLAGQLALTAAMHAIPGQRKKK